MRKVWAVLRVLGVLVLAFVFLKNMQLVTLRLYLGYSLTLPFFLWLVLAGVFGIVLGYASSRFQFRRWMVQQTSVTQALSVGVTAGESSANAPRISSLAEALKAV